MSAKRHITLLRALKTDYAYLIALMGFSCMSLYGYRGTWYFHDVLATFSLLLTIRCTYLHFLLLMLIAIIPIGTYPLMGMTGLPSDNLFVLLWTNPLNTLDVITKISISESVPSLILLVLIVILTVLQRIKTPGFNLLRLEFLVVFVSTLIFSALFNGLSEGWDWGVIDYPPLAYWIAVIKEGIASTVWQ